MLAGGGTVTNSSGQTSINTSSSPIRTGTAYLSPGVDGDVNWTLGSSQTYMQIGKILKGYNAAPIELIGFQAYAMNNTAQTSWEVASQINNDYFTIERSRDAIHFEGIAHINGAGNTNKVMEYAFTDESPYPGVSYYRLRQTDFDGKTEVFPMRAIDMGAAATADLSVKVFPNPLHQGPLVASINGELKGLVSLEIYDMTGNIVYQKTITTNNQQPITLEGLQDLIPSGVYLLKIRDQQNSTAQKFVLQ
jgi:hypothetical protein